MSVNLDTILEWTSVIFGLLYLILLIYEKIWCWFFGIVGSALSIWLFYRTQLYSESILYIYYVVIGFYGWYVWSKLKPQKLQPQNSDILDDTADHPKSNFQEWSLLSHLLSILICSLLALGLGWVFNSYTDAKNAWLDAFTTIFSFYASFLETRKVVSAWLYWIVLNGASVYLYDLRDLDVYAFLAIVYFIASFIGFFQWRKKHRLHSG